MPQKQGTITRSTVAITENTLRDVTFTWSALGEAERSVRVTSTSLQARTCKNCTSVGQTKKGPNDTEADIHMQEMLAEMLPLTVLPLAPSLPQLPAATSRAGQQLPLPPPPPTTSGPEQGLLQRALHMPPPSEAEHAGCSKEPLSPVVQSLMDTHAELQRKAEEQKVQKKRKKADRPLTSSPGMALPKLSAGPLTAEQIQVVQEVLTETESQVPFSGAHPRIDAPQELISLLPTLPASSEPDLLIPLKELPTDIMEHEEVGPEKQAQVDEVEMAETEPTA